MSLYIDKHGTPWKLWCNGLGERIEKFYIHNTLYIDERIKRWGISQTSRKVGIVFEAKESEGKHLYSLLYNDKSTRTMVVYIRASLKNAKKQRKGLQSFWQLKQLLELALHIVCYLILHSASNWDSLPDKKKSTPTKHIY